MSQVRDILNQQKIVETPFFIIGKAFFGKKDISQKDGSYTATLWMTFLNLPIYPFDSYRILNSQETILPKVFGLDEYIMVKSVNIKFDVVQVLWTLALMYGSLLLTAYVTLFLSIEHSALHGIGFILFLITVYTSVLVWNHHELNKQHKIHPRKIEKVEVAPHAPEKVVSPIPNHPVVVPAPIEAQKPAVAYPPTVPAQSISKVEHGAPITHVEPSHPVHMQHVQSTSEPIMESAPMELEKPLRKSKKKISVDIHIRRPEPVLPARVAEPKVIASPVVEPEPMPIPVAPKPVMATATPGPDTRPANQIKFDPNKIMEFNASDIDLHPRVVAHPYEIMNGTDWLGFLTVVLLLVQFIGRLYFMLFSNQIGYMIQVQRIFTLVYENFVLSIIGVILFAFTIKRSPFIAIPLLLLSIAFFLKLQNRLFDLLLNT